ncbi:MAG: DUF3641 domain-containing protein [Cytophagia bacterium]|nr:DUF3641 domain-containing protein [Cytophagia bacterium]
MLAVIRLQRTPSFVLPSHCFKVAFPSSLGLQTSHGFFPAFFISQHCFACTAGAGSSCQGATA